MNYSEALNYIEGVGKFGMKLGLSRMEKLLEFLSNPQEKIKVIHVGGTNGKGSTTTFISSILMSQGYSVGVYTSPHLERYTERIKINGIEIEEEEFAQIISDIAPIIDKVNEEGYGQPTQFEILTTCAFKYFKDLNVDFVILEVGLGGRLDATNVCIPLLSVITNIGLDHTHILGDTLSQIASEKAGIIKKGIPLVLYPQEKEAMDVIVARANEMGSKIYNVSELEDEILSNDLKGCKFNIKGTLELDNLTIKMLGGHQIKNAKTGVLAIKAIRDLGFHVSDDAIYKGLMEASWPGRFEVLNDNPCIVLDGCHNLQGVNAFVEALNKYFPGKKIKIVCGILSDKDYSHMIELLSSVSNDYITVTPNSNRALCGSDLRDLLIGLGKKAVYAKSLDEAVELAMDNSSDVYAFCGSLYMIGDVRSIILSKIADKTY